MPGSTDGVLPRPIISGLPPLRVYIHPDEQMEVLQKQRSAGKAGWPDPELKREREWVLPSHLRESWSAERFAVVLDTPPAIPAYHSQDMSSRQAS